MNKLLVIIASFLLIVSCVSQNKATKVVALTFDDGPDITKTNLMLDQLEKYEVKASFFAVGQLINEQTQPTMQRAIDLGCEYHNHSWEWSSMDGMTEEEIMDSVNKTTAAIEEYTGTSPVFFRPPNLATSQTMFDTIPYPFASGLIAWDWDGGTTDKQRAEAILSNVEDGSIILLHDVQPHDTHGTLDVLIPQLKKQGYEIVTLTELFERKGVDPSSLKNGMWTVVK